MRFGMFFELQMPKPWSENAEYNTLWQAVEQVAYAEEMGFEHVWLVEHHFLTEFAHSSAPEVTLAIMAEATCSTACHRVLYSSFSLSKQWSRYATEL